MNEISGIEMKNTFFNIFGKMAVVSLIAFFGLLSPQQAAAGDPSYEETMQWIKSVCVGNTYGSYKVHNTILDLTWDKFGNIKKKWKWSRDNVSEYTSIRLDRCPEIEKSYRDTGNTFSNTWSPGCIPIRGFNSEEMADRVAKAWHHAYLKSKAASPF